MRYIILLAISLCSFTIYSQVKISKEKGVDLSKYQTFVVQQGQVIASSNELGINEHKFFVAIRDVITREMTLRGYQPASDSTAQLLISYVLDDDNKLTSQKTGPLGQTPTTDPSTIDESYRTQANANQRTLIIEVETKKEGSLWTANCIITSAQKDISKALDLTIASAFKKFPQSKK